MGKRQEGKQRGGSRKIRPNVFVFPELALVRVRSFHSQRLHGVDPAGSPGRYPAGQQGHPHYTPSHRAEGPGVRGADLVIVYPDWKLRYTLLSGLLGLLTSGLAALYPAWRAVRMTPAEALRE